VAGYDSTGLIERALEASRELSDVDDAQTVAVCALAAAVAELAATVSSLGVTVADVAEALSRDEPG
jgi:hypothetical protein